MLVKKRKREPSVKQQLEQKNKDERLPQHIHKKDQGNKER